MPTAKLQDKKDPPEGGQGNLHSHVAAWPLYSTDKNESVESFVRHTVLLAWESLAENLGGGGDWVGGIL